MRPDIWAVIVPNYIAALGGLAATALAVISLILAQSARRQSAATARNDSDTRDALGLALDALEEQQTAEVREGYIVPVTREPDIAKARAILESARSRTTTPPAPPPAR